MDLSVAYVNVFVSDFERAVEFYAQTLGLPLKQRDDEFKYASFATVGAKFAVVEVDSADEPGLVDRHTGVGLAVKDLDSAYAALEGNARFAMPPTKQPWGGYMALLEDPDGNIFYLDQVVDP